MSMWGRLQPAISLLVLVPTAWAAVEGTVVNQTTGRPQAGAAVTLMKLGTGMDSVGTAKTDAQGRFRIEHDVDARAPYLLQAQHQTVNYNRMIPPGAASSNLDLEVFDAAPQVPSAKVTQHMILLEPSESKLQVNESIVYNNDGKLTANDPKGTFSFYLPPGAEQDIRVMARSGTRGMPLERTPEKAGEPNTYRVKFPVKPGETLFDLTYSLPGAASFSGRLLHGGGPLRLIAPRGVSLKGEGLESLGPEPRTQATIYNVSGDRYAVEITGTGSLRQPADPSAQDPSAQEETGPEIQPAKPRIYQRLPWLITFAALILGLSLVLLYRSERRRE